MNNPNDGAKKRVIAIIRTMVASKTEDKSINFEMRKTVTDNNIMRIANAVIAHF